MPELIDSKDLRQRIIEESRGYVSIPKQADEFAVKDFQEANGIGYDRAREALDRMEVDGKVERRKSGARVYYKFTGE